ncbi:hypothetical protein [Inhella sp.]
MKIALLDALDPELFDSLVSGGRSHNHEHLGPENALPLADARP